MTNNDYIVDIFGSAKVRLAAPVAYQGGKQRIASKIIDYINPNGDIFWDLCCGSGAISIELINRGYDPHKIMMVDIGPWGTFWKMIGEGTFDTNRFLKLCIDIPSDISKIHDYVQALSDKPVDDDEPYVFLILQSAAFGSKAIWNKDKKWMNCSFRNYWLPTKTSNRKSPVNPMMPMPATLFNRVCNIATNMKGVVGVRSDIDSVIVQEDEIVYIDPPYSNTTMYGYDFDVVKFAKNLHCDLGKSVRVFVSEGKPLSDKSIMIEGSRKKGGISGERKTVNEEWLSEFN